MQINPNPIDLVTLDFGNFTASVFSCMDVTIQIHEDGNFWNTHVSKLNEGKYPELYSSFVEFIGTHDVSERFELTLDDFRFIMEKIFKAYCLMK